MYNFYSFKVKHFNKVSWHVESYLITTKIAIFLYHFLKRTVCSVSVLLRFINEKLSCLRPTV